MVSASSGSRASGLTVNKVLCMRSVKGNPFRKDEDEESNSQGAFAAQRMAAAGETWDRRGLLPASYKKAHDTKLLGAMARGDAKRQPG